MPKHGCLVLRLLRSRAGASSLATMICGCCGSVQRLVADGQNTRLIRPDKHIEIANLVLLQLRLFRQRRARPGFKLRLIFDAQRLATEILRMHTALTQGELSKAFLMLKIG